MRYAQIRKMDVSNGEGIGVALFVQGCHFHCKNCFNSDTWSFDGGYEWTDNKKRQFLKLIDNPHINRVSLLGGEPLDIENLQDVLTLVNEIKKAFPEKNIWLYSGYELESIFLPLCFNRPLTEEEANRVDIVKSCDIMVDGRYFDDLKDMNLHYRGSSNQRIIDIKRTMNQKEIVLWKKQ